MGIVRFSKNTMDGAPGMCELLVRTIDKNNSDPYLDVHLTKRGDVIHIAPDGWSWGSDELTNVSMLIIQLPNITEAQAAAFLTPEVNTNPLNPSIMLQRRAFKLDLDDPILLEELGTKRTKPKYALNINFGQLNSMKIAKPSIPDPNIL